MYAAPQTPDGRLVAARPDGGGGLEVDIAFPVPESLRRVVEGREAHLIFAARSRLARLGVDVAPSTPLAWDGDVLGMSARVRATVRAYAVGAFLAPALVPGVRAGRLVFCPPEARLGSDQVDQALLANELQLPADYSIDQDGRFRLRPAGWVYDLAEPLTLATFKSIVSRTDGKDLLNRIQVRRAVDRIVLEPEDGVITSCSMFLHRHYVVLESEESPLGRHLEAVCLDPVSTRGTSIFLEFANHGPRRIVNPSVSAALYRAERVTSEPRRWYGVATVPAAAPDPSAEARAEYARIVEVFDRLEAPCDRARYSHRMVAVATDLPGLLRGEEPQLVWRRPPASRTPLAGADVSQAEIRRALSGLHRQQYGTSLLAEVPAGAQVTLLMGTFPNLVEHTQICSAALEGKVRCIVFRRASYEHGSFLSSRDHGRLADYRTLGLEVYWCNDDRGHVAVHHFRGLRGFFMEPRNVDRFRSALIFAGYGSSKPLSASEVERVSRVLTNLRSFFGEDISLMTGGGPGAMQQATDLAQSLGMMVGASFIETVDQKTNKTADYYQTFQGRSRQARQRWFEVASFHLFFMGGVGTLEEVGLTLTDMKLGVIELSPLVFLGCHGRVTYWDALRRQFETMVAAGRAPAWLADHVLVSDDPDAIPRFYKRVLELG
jgi:hypothetical protein